MLGYDVLMVARSSHSRRLTNKRTTSKYGGHTALGYTYCWRWALKITRKSLLGRMLARHFHVPQFGELGINLSLMLSRVSYMDLYVLMVARCGPATVGGARLPSIWRVVILRFGLGGRALKSPGNLF